MKNLQDYKNAAMELFCTTAKIYTLRFLRPQVERKQKQDISRIYDIFVSMAFGQIRKIKEIKNSDADLPTRACVIAHGITCKVQRDTCEEVLQYCQACDRMEKLDTQIENCTKKAQEIYDQLPKQILTYQQRHMDTVFKLRPLLVKDDDSLFNHQKIFTFFKQEAKEDRGDYRLCNDRTEHILTLDDFVPEKFYFGDSPRRAGAFYALMENFGDADHQHYDDSHKNYDEQS